MNLKSGPVLAKCQAVNKQSGGLTIFTAIFVLILMTLMLFYASKVGVFEQRVSSNDARQKLAFQTAEAGIDYAMEYLLAANMRILSRSDEAMPDGQNTDPVTFRPGWFSDANTLWAECPGDPGNDHPCGGEILSGGAGSLYFDDPGTTTEGSFDGYRPAVLPKRVKRKRPAVLAEESMSESDDEDEDLDGTATLRQVKRLNKRISQRLP